MIKVVSRILGVAALCGTAVMASAPALAQQTADAQAAVSYPYTAPSPESLAFAQARGQLIFAYDQAAWHSTDAFLTEYDQALGPYMRGYVVVPSDSGGTLDAVYFGDFGAGPVEVARYTVDGSEVVAGGFHPADARPPLSAMASRLADARQAVMGALSGLQLTLCANAQANTITVPDGDGAQVYIMTPLTDMDSIPLGGHYRFSVDAAGQVTQLHRLEDGCATALLPEITPDTQAVLLTPVAFTRAAEPSEVHVWASMMRPVPMFVETPRSRTVWVVDGGTIRELGEEDVAAAPPGTVTSE